MRKRIFNIFTLTLLATVFGQGITYAQEEGEGGQLPLKAESTVIEKDSTQEVRNNEGESRNDLMNPIVITPKNKPANVLELNQLPINSATPKKSTVGEKVKEEETQSNLRFNFIYYLFYKFKVGSSSSGGK